MADKDEKTPCNGRKNDDSNDTDTTGVTLNDFITDQYEKQKEDGRMNPTDDISEERRISFLERALRESERMSMEAERSQAKVAALHAEFSQERFSQWRDEHAAEVLLPHQAKAISLASQQNMDSYYANHPQPPPTT